MTYNFMDLDVIYYMVIIVNELQPKPINTASAAVWVITNQ